ncbi:Nif11-like leader peptide family natural product precursor [Oleisolibacter albus]|uniref:Nif11-like leader peptide family natural product precursor n=1 Tax=Oleisolibacter albus TaxID=2171757 RepID=UPI00138FB061|nr:Nif11-like leader peptide family natural product precursor [Oleisolibacter albus]
MSEAALIEFYRLVREDEAVMGRLAACRTPEELVAAVVEESARRGLSVDAPSVELALSDLKSFIDLANDDALTDLELEIVSAGSGAIGGYGSKDGWPG